jgi:maleate cis-trans isomerase
LWLESNADNAQTMDRMNSELESGVEYLMRLHPSAITMAGTTNSFYRGSRGAAWMESVMSRGIPGIASSPSVEQALRALGARRISVATPYPVWNNNRLRDYFTAAGFEVLNVEGDDRVADGNAQRMNDQDPAEILEFGLRVMRPDADALFCSCSGWRAMEAAAELEQHLGRPVVTTNQATLWRTLRAVGVQKSAGGFGQLLDLMPTTEDGW